VIEAIDRFYRRDNANVHRGVHELSHRATEAYEQARGKVARLLGIADEAELVWTKGTTEGINLVARTWGDQTIRAGDEILLSVLEHHSNLVPWQLLAQRTGAKLRFLDIDDQGRLDLSNLDDLLTERTKLVSIAHISNALGTVNPVSEIAARAHAVGRGDGGGRGPERPAPPGGRAHAWGATSTRSAATRCAAPRESAGCGAAARCWRPCRPSTAAAT
jgi:cysteine desulfurase/selenocysteine lyase